MIYQSGKHININELLICFIMFDKLTVYVLSNIVISLVCSDRYVLLGNHRDAWVFGAIDPSSGTAVMKEISRGMANLVKQGM